MEYIHSQWPGRCLVSQARHTLKKDASLSGTSMTILDPSRATKAHAMHGKLHWHIVDTLIP